MTEVELFGRTHRSPLPLPPGYWLAPLVALAIVAGAFLRPYDRAAAARDEKPPVAKPAVPDPGHDNSPARPQAADRIA